MKTILNTLITVAMLFALSAHATPKQSKQEINLTVTEEGFVPKDPEIKPGIPTVLKITRKTKATCATQVIIATKKIKHELPLDKEVSIDLGKLSQGDLKFSCGMDMITGVIHVK